MPTQEQAEKAWKHGSKGKAYYDAMTDEQKKAMWQYGFDRKLIDVSRLGPGALAEYNKYVDPAHPEYKPATPIVAIPKQYYMTQSEKLRAAILPQSVKSLAGQSPEQIATPKIQAPVITSNVIDRRLQKAQQLEGLTPNSKPKTALVGNLLPREVQTTGNTGEGLGRALLAPLSTINSVLQTPATMGKYGVREMEKAQAEGKNAIGGLLKGYGTGLKKAITNQDAAENIEVVEGIAPKATGSLKEKFPNAYNAASTIVNFFGVDDLTAWGLIGDIAKVRKLNSGINSTADLARISAEGIKDAEKVAKIMRDNPDIVKAVDNIPEDELQKVMYVDPYGNVRKTTEPTPLLESPKTDLSRPQILNREAPKTISQANIKPPELPKQLVELPKVSSDVVTPPIQNKSLAGLIKAPDKEAIELLRTNKNVNALPLNNKSLNRERRLKQTIIKSPLANPALKRKLNTKQLVYDPITNSDTLKSAQKIVNSNFNEAIQRVKSGAATAENNAVGMEIVRKLQDEGRYDEAIEIIGIVSKKATESGQAIQALSMWGRLTPEGILKYTQSLFDKSNNEMLKEGYKLPNKIKLTETFAKDITERMEKINSMPEGRIKTVEIAKVLRDIDEQIPKSIWRKVSTIQTIAQLLNPKTMVRNTLGNTIFGGLENISNMIGTPMDTIISKVTGQRTTIFPSIKTQIEAGAKGFVEAVEDALQGIDTRGVGTKFELGTGSTFKRNTLMGKLERGLNVGLRSTDAAFSDAAKAESLRQQMKIAGVTKPTTGMIKIANKVADYRTFQDSNSLSEGFKHLKEGLNKVSGFFTGTTEWGLGDLVIKYSKTPANILARGIEYSPISAIKAINEVINPLRGKVFNQKDFVDAVSRGATGTSLIVMGYQLNKLGLITGAADRDYDVASLKRDIGQGEYRLNTTALRRYINSNNPEDAKPKKGDLLVSWDWTAPTSIMLGIGANIGQKKGNTTDLLTTLIDASVSGVNTLVEQPLLTGIQKLTGGYDPIKNVTNVVKGAPASFTPSLLSQARQLVDNTTRNNYSPEYGKEAGNMVKARLPLLSKSLEPRITTLGKTKEIYQNDSNNLLNVFLNPAYVSKYDPTPAAEMVLDIYEKSGEKIQFPKIASTYIMKDGKKVNLLPEQVTALQKYMGEETLKAFNEYAKSTAFRNLQPEEQAKKLQNILTKISQEAKKKVVLPQLEIK